MVLGPTYLATTESAPFSPEARRTKWKLSYLLLVGVPHEVRNHRDLQKSRTF